MRIITVFILFFLPVILFAQQTVKDSINNSSNSKWSFSASTYYNFVYGNKNTLNLVGSADHKSLHIETRYNYEDKNTVSIFGGKKFETGNKLKFEATPMIGISFGNTNGITPALELELAYKIFDLYSESECLVDYKGRENNFFYTWSELGMSISNSLRTGISVQNTFLYKTKADIQRGVFVKYSFWKFTAGTYYFNPFSKNNFILTALTVEW